ncbi:MAG: ferritin-like domain-containing protein [Maricaulaceae bacterium]
MRSIYDCAQDVLQAGSSLDKPLAARKLSSYWSENKHIGAYKFAPCDRPARPETPVLVPPYDVPRRRLGSQAGRAALLHAVAHIEFNAIDLAADMIARFGASPLLPDDKREDFIEDWVSVCDDEARHFCLIKDRLEQMDCHYGALPAHDGLWEAAFATKDNFAARLAVAPLVLEARGLDVTPAMIGKLERAGDTDSAAILNIIYTEEVGHVAIGKRWFSEIASHADGTEIAYFQTLVRQYFKGPLKPPFNKPARTKAGLTADFYEPLAPITGIL